MHSGAGVELFFAHDMLYLVKNARIHQRRRKKMIGTEWKLAKLVRRCDLNGQIVRVDGVHNDRYVVSLTSVDGPNILVKAINLVSLNDANIRGDMLQDAVAHLESTTMDERLRKAAEFFNSGEFSQALGTAGKWTLDQVKQRS